MLLSPFRFCDTIVKRTVFRGCVYCAVPLAVCMVNTAIVCPTSAVLLTYVAFICHCTETELLNMRVA
jgi:hypothetical protein